MSSRAVWMAMAAGTLALMGGAPVCWAQPGQEPAVRGRGPGTGTGGGSEARENVGTPVDAEGLRIFLQQRTTDLEHRLTVMREAIRRLDAGTEADEVRRYLRAETPMLGWALDGRGGDRRGRGGRGSGGDDSETGAPGALDSPPPPPPPPHGGPGEGFGPPPHGGPLSDEDLAAVREFLAASDPGLLERLDALAAQDPEGARRRFGEVAPRVRWMIEMRKRDPEMYQLRLQEVIVSRQAIALAREFGRLESSPSEGGRDEAERARVKKELRAAASRLVDLRVAGQAMEIARLQDRLDALRGKIESETSDHERRVDEQYLLMVEQAKLSPGGRERPRQRRE